MMMHKRSVFIVGGGGMVGATAAHALAIKEVVSNVVLIDVAEDLVRGQAMDINHATAYTHGVHVHVGDYSDMQDGDIVVITCGVPQKDAQSRLELIETNAGVIRSVIGNIKKQGKEVFIVMVSNPVDVLTYVALKESGLPKSHVFGTGTMLDTARLRVTLANKLNVSQRHVDGYILGEHGDSSFPALSQVRIGGLPLADFPGYTANATAHIADDIRKAAYEIIEAKKATYYGIGNVVTQVVEALQRDAASILSVCSLAEGEYGLRDVVVGLPTLVSSEGVRILDNYPLDDAEQQQLQKSAAVIREVIDQLNT
jgi:L-lactate dehydrogenase